MSMKIAVAKGDGIGPEIMDAVVSVFKAAGVPLEFDFIDMGKYMYDKGFSNGMSDEAKEKIETYGILFKGPMETPKGKGVKSINVTARKVWNTYANERIFRSLPGVDTYFSRSGLDIDITIIRENIEDTYSGIEHMLTRDITLSRRFITRPGCEQVIRYAFELARRKKAEKLTCAHKANIMKITDGLFLEVFYEIAKQYPEIPVNDLIVDDLAMKLVTKPHDFDVVVLTNLQGDIISDLCAGLVGGLGFAPSANIGDQISIFEAVHGTAPDIAGKQLANPTSLLMSGIMMLRHLNLPLHADMIQDALIKTLKQGLHTADFGKKDLPPLKTQEFADAIINNLERDLLEVSSHEQVHFHPVQKPEKHIMRGAMYRPEDHLVGADYFVATEDQPKALAEKIRSVLPSGLELVIISNRGTQVWPSASRFTELVSGYRVRIQSAGNTPIHENLVLETGMLLQGHMTLNSIEMLRMYDGKPGFLLAQGQ